MKAKEDLYVSLINTIKNTVPISDSDLNLVIELFEPKQLNKKEFLLFKGDVSHHMRFVCDGCLRVYSNNEKGEEFIVQFGIKNWWVNDLHSYLSNAPAQYTIQAIRASTVLQIHRDKLETLFNKVPIMERFFRIKIQSAYVATQVHTLKAISETSESRYLNFLSKYRDIEQAVPQYMVASYLGISPEHLSTIRKKLHQ
ncbi:Crp/Fnr family transcriptional regulator [Aequorivita sp. SDUM287046]|uniref:Crp/Fnr family transcriptional regulator n=1 Tax=Aequorivita aurantiaca TaxID=3053356 RepID=A0ABT8DGT1_9FLAO|nr:Crp/Fnr family transcriptional regulator [Aequorivita aurantiaca]MDN3724123.1 Crp/Fnr family transcriptional regulator [Aequorivita aurantiaca]